MTALARLRARLARRPVQRKADESTAAAALGYRRPRLGIDVAPIACPLKAPPHEEDRL